LLKAGNIPSFEEGARRRIKKMLCYLSPRRSLGGPTPVWPPPSRRG